MKNDGFRKIREEKYCLYIPVRGEWIFRGHHCFLKYFPESCVYLGFYFRLQQPDIISKLLYFNLMKYTKVHGFILFNAFSHIL